MINQDFLDILICPKMIARNKETSLVLKGDSLINNIDNFSYNIIQDIPDLRIDQGKVDYDEMLDMFMDHKTPEFISKLNKAMELKDIEGNVLIAGAATGTEIAQIKEFNPKLVVAVDYSNKIHNLIKHKKLFPDNTVFLQADLCNLPIKSNCFDFVLSSGVLHHTRSPELSFRHLWRVLKKDGRLNLGHLYLQGASNNLITQIREKYRFHEMKPEEAYAKLKKMIFLRRILKKIGLNIFHRKFKWPIYLHISHATDHLPDYALAQAMDYYRARYRHTLRNEDVFSWFEQVGMTVRKTAKGWEGIKS